MAICGGIARVSIGSVTMALKIRCGLRHLSSTRSILCLMNLVFVIAPVRVLYHALQPSTRLLGTGILCRATTVVLPVKVPDYDAAPSTSPTAHYDQPLPYRVVFHGR